MNYRVKCSFCPNIDLNDLGYNATYIGSHTYSCSACKSHFFYEVERLVGWVFSVTYKSKYYTIDWNERDSKTYLSTSLKTICSFNNRPDLTPHNLVKKLPNILLFL